MALSYIVKICQVVNCQAHVAFMFRVRIRTTQNSIGSINNSHHNPGIKKYLPIICTVKKASYTFNKGYSVGKNNICTALIPASRLKQDDARTTHLTVFGMKITKWK